MDALDSYLEVAEAYAALGPMIQKQLRAIVDGAADEWNVAPGAIQVIRRRFLPTLGRVDEDAAADLEVALDYAVEVVG